MKILYVHDALAVFGGIERVLTDKMNWFVEHTDYQIHLLTVDQGVNALVFPLHPEITYYDLDIRFHQQYQVPIWGRWHVHRRLRLLFRQRLKNKLQEIIPDIIICTRIDYLKDIVKVKGCIPLVLESHSTCMSTLYDHDGFLRRIRIKNQQSSLKQVDMVVALTQGDAYEWKKLTNRVQVIPNTVHLNDTGRICNRSLRSVIYVGRDVMQKDLDSLMHIWQMVYQNHPDWRLHIYGKTPRMADGVVVHEPTSQMADAYLNASVLLLTSLYEPFGLVLPEAMSYGLPVVAFDCPYGPADIITDGVDGFIIRDRKVVDFANRVCQLIEDNNLCVEMGKAGFMSSQRYHAGQIMPKWIKLFEMIVGNSV